MAQPTVTAPPIPGQRLRMSYEEWLAWNDREVKSEWVDGEMIVFMSTTGPHA